MTYTRTVTVNMSYEQAMERTRVALAEQGFGILTEIDVNATFAAKLGDEAADKVGDCTILGACNRRSGQQGAGRRAGARRPAAVQRRGAPRQGRRADDHRGHRPANHGPAQRQCPGAAGRRRCRREAASYAVGDR